MRSVSRVVLVLLPFTLLLSQTSSVRPAHAATLHRGVSVWLPYWSMSAANASTISNAGVIRTASPFWYAISGDSTLVAHSGAGSTDLISAWHGKGMKVVPTVTEGQNAHDFGLMATSSSRRAAHVSTLSRIVRSRSYNGLDLDYEAMAVFRGAKSDADADRAGKGLTLLVRDACAMLHRLSKKCVVTVMARTDDSHTYFRNVLATFEYDYREISKVADTVRVMAYGEHGPTSGAGPIASIGWVKKIVAYAHQTIPVARTELALPAYGEDWSSSGNVSVTGRGAAATAAKYGARVTYSSTAHECTYVYYRSGVKHTVWYGDPRSIDERTGLAIQARLSGIALWAAGQELSGTWPRLRARFTY